MPNQRAILCGDARGGDLPLNDPKPLRLSHHGKQANVHLAIEDVRRAMWRELPAVFEDLIDIATYVYAADQAVRRDKNGVDDFGADWRRELFFRIPVRDADFWSQDSVRGELASVLSFLSDDRFQFEFVPNEEPRPLQKSLEFIDDPWSGFFEEAMLYSGGLDSLAGAIQECLVDKRRTLLVNHRSTEKLSRRHRILLDMLLEKAEGMRPIHIPVRINKVKELSFEYTQRTRSFLYASLAATLASMVGLNRIRFYENGVVGLNLPLSGQVVGARATRTTHPRVLKGFESLFSAVAGKRFTVENRFLWKSKTEVIQLIAEHGCAEMIRFATTCMHTWEITNDRTHCGACSQCIDRRFAVLAAGQADYDPAEAYKVDLLTGARDEGEPRAMLAAYANTANLMERMDAQAFFETFGEAFRVLKHVDGTPDAVAMEIFKLHHRHAKHVVGVIDEGLGKYSAEIRRRELSATCLLRLVSDASGSTRQSPDRPGALQTTAQDGCSSRNYICRKGRCWAIRFDSQEEQVYTPDVGFEYLLMLLERPGVEFSASQLYAMMARRNKESHMRIVTEDEFGGNGAAVSAGLDGDEILDEEGCDSLETRRNEILGTLELLRATSSPSRLETIEELEQELMWIENTLRSAHGLGGRKRQLHDDRNRVRNRVCNAIRRALKQIHEYDLRLAEHLKKPVLNLGHSVNYVPREGLLWALSPHCAHRSD